VTSIVSTGRFKRTSGRSPAVLMVGIASDALGSRAEYRLCEDGGVAYRVVRPDELEYEERAYREDEPPRQSANVTEAAGLEQSRARMWRYPPGTRGRRHRDHGQEEVFVVLQGELVMYLGEPPERVQLPQGSVAAVGIGTALQVRNESDREAVAFIYGAPPVEGQSEMLDDLPA
jgi:quercetin dioxygenase-like cupin family protein